MLRHLAQIGSELGCSRIVLHTRIDREQAHSFYEQKAKFDKKI
ncbi:MAG: hypothetical protein D6808_06760 [Candidatus Dadabacteria bacterium]|nr:MAG: hypothetical protein D6808_06760 [Candidatus Dadabacteria bacterium]